MSSCFKDVLHAGLVRPPLRGRHSRPHAPISCSEAQIFCILSSFGVKRKTTHSYTEARHELRFQYTRTVKEYK